MQTHRDLDAWKLSMQLTTDIYKLTKEFPKEELYGLTSQLRRAAISIPSNIAEGAARQTKKEYVQFLYCALGSSAELETQLELSKRLNYADDSALDPMFEMQNRVARMLSGLIRKWKK